MNGPSAGKRMLVAVALTLAFVGWVVPSAQAEFGPIELISKSPFEQADRAEAPAISGDGRYVAFAGTIGGRDGVFRKDLQTGALALVAELESSEAAERAWPSISEDGRYVAFTTLVPLDPANDQVSDSKDVYVADMSTTPPSYELASARDDCDPAVSEECGLTYADPSIGSVAAGRVALSADGRSVAFLVRTKSDLAQEPGEAETSPGQVAVRRLATDETILITQTMGAPVPDPVLGGGAATASEGAAISADGSTVAWVGRRLPAQVPMLADEEARVKSFEGDEPSSVGSEYHEPLWRRVPTALDQDPPTRRVVGGGDPLAAGCPPGGTLSDSACQGPFPDSARTRLVLANLEGSGPGWGLGVPRLSRDGEVVAFVGNPDEGTDVYLVNMAAGLSRRQAVRRLTHWVNAVPGENDPGKAFGSEFTSFSGPISDCAISPDGNRIAFTTGRRVFPLAPPTLVSQPPSGSGAPELYQVDLTGQTIERVTPGGSGTVSLGPDGSSKPSYSDDGRLLAFASGAYNLVGGDANESTDAFVVESPLPAPVDESSISPRPAALVVKPLWRMTVDVASLRNGRVKVVVGVPGAGSLRVAAAARLGRKLKLRRVASASRQAAAAGVQRLELRLPRKLRHLAHQKGGLYAQIDVDFTGPGGKPLNSALDARFLVRQRKAKK